MIGQKKRFWKDWPRNKKWLFVIFCFTILGTLILVAFTIKNQWNAQTESLSHGMEHSSLGDIFAFLNVLLPVVITPILFFTIKRFRNWICKTVGEEFPLRFPFYRVLFPMVISLPFVFFVLSSNADKVIPPVLEFSVIAVAPTLGGLVLAAANRRALKKPVYNELVGVAQKLIISSILLIIFVSLIYATELIGGINVVVIDWSISGFSRWIFYWSGLWSFYIGIFLFILGITDLVFTLHHLRK